MYYLGLDVGGTYIKGGIVNSAGKVVCKSQVPTESQGGAQAVLDNAVSLIEQLCSDAGLTAKDIIRGGAGVPGMIDADKGIVIYNNNLGWRNIKLASYIHSKTGIKFLISNDANTAALGESIYGSGKGYQNSVFLTLGTGVGGGVIIDGKVFEGNKGAGAELGHMVIKMSGEKCTCGRRGCIEMYCSATALIRQTKTQMLKDRDSLLWKACNNDIDSVNGKTAFDVYLQDDSAKKVINNYTNYLAEGLANFANIFRPEIMLIGGGISKQGDELTDILRAKLKKRIYGGKMGPPVELKTAILRNDAGFLGGAALAMRADV